MFSQWCVFVLAGCAVGAAAFAEFELSELEVLVELAPLVLGGFAVFGLGSCGPPVVQERPVVADQVVLEDREVCLRGVDVGVAEDLGGDVNGQAAGDRFGDEHVPQVVHRPVGAQQGIDPAEHSP